MPVASTDVAQLAEPVRERATAAETALLRLLVRHLRAGVERNDWDLRVTLRRAAFQRELDELLRSLRADGEAALAEAVNLAYLRGGVSAARDLAKREDDGTSPLAPLLLAGLVTDAVSRLRATEQAVRSVGQRAVNQAVLAARNSANGPERLSRMQPVLNQVADRGVTGFVTPRGDRWGLVEYLGTVASATAGRALIRGYRDRLEVLDHDLVMVSAHGGSCPLCAPWQGKVLSIGGRTPGYPSLAAAEAAGYGHIHCRHSLFAWEPGLEVPFWQPERDRETAYADSQRQRAIERTIRKWKRREIVSLTEAERRLDGIKVKQWQKAAREHVAATGVFRKYEREQV